MIFAEHVKNKLSSLIHEMATAPWLFSKNPEVDFSRNRKLDFVSTIQFLLSMESGSLKKELLDYFQFSVDTPVCFSVLSTEKQTTSGGIPVFVL
ncbi:MAG: hypothetical protein ACLTPG_13245 [Mediterraneibacter gnavus]